MQFSISRIVALAAIFLAGVSEHSYSATINGGEGNDTITGTSSADVIDARGGNDTVTGLGGGDNIQAGDGDDSVDGGEGSDTIDGGFGIDTVKGGPGDDSLTDFGISTVQGGAGNDKIIRNFPGGYEAYTDGLRAYGEEGNDTILTPAFRVIDAGPGDDLVTITDLPYIPAFLSGGEGYDVLNLNWSGWDCTYDHSAGATQKCGIWSVTSGFEEIHFNSSSDAILPDNVGAPGTTLKVVIEPAAAPIFLDFSQETNASINYSGSRRKCLAVDNCYNDTFISGQIADRISVFEGNDTVAGNGGDDNIDGGDGADTAIYSGNFADYTVSEVTYNTFTVRDNRVGSPDGTDTIVDVNKLQFADKTVDVVIRGLNIVGDEQVNKLAGTGYADRLEGMGGNDDLSGNAGNDQIIGGTGADRMAGGSGDDSYDFDSTSDTATEAGGGGVDIVRSSVSINPLSAYVENLTLTGSASLNGTGNSMNNVITGNAGANVLSGGGGSDKLVGGLGDDTYYGNTSGVPGTDVDTVSFEDRAAAVIFNLALTTVQATGGAGNDRIPNGSIENLVGGSGGDRLTGTNGANRIEGRAGNDTILGMLGPDVLIGNGGLDVINCGAETVNNVDTVTYLAAGDSVVGANRDQIVNFKSGDRISLGEIDANAKVAGNQAFTFNMTTPRANSVWYVKSGANLIVKGDVNGNTTPDFEILVKDRSGLLSIDFVL